MRTITGGGSFTRQNISDINANFSEVSGGGSGASIADVDIWVRPQHGNNNNAGTYDAPFATMAGAARAIVPGIVIGVEGVLTEEYSGPIVNDVTIIGAKSNQARQATTSGVPNGGGATWLSPSGGTGSLLTVNGQAWRIQNIYFNNTATGTGTGCIKLVGGGDPPATADSAHTQILGCVITGEANGVLFSGGPGFVTIDGCKLFYFDSSGDKAIASEAGSPGGGTGWGAVLRNNNFTANLSHIVAPAYGWQVYNNRFSYIDVGVTTTVQINFTNGSNNSVYNNQFDVPYNAAGLTAMFTAGTNDRWSGNAMGTAVLTPMTGLLWGVPTSGAA